MTAAATTRREARPERDRVARPVGVVAGRQDDDERVGRRVEPHRRPGPAGVAEGAEREEVAPARRVVRLDVPAEGAQVAVAEVPDARHRGDAGRREPAAAVAEERPGVAREVVGGAEEAGVPRHAAEGPGAGVVDLPAEEDAVLLLGRRDPRDGKASPLSDRAELRLGHPERVEDRPPRVDVERLPGHRADQLAEDLVARVGVDEPLSRGVQEAALVLPREDLGGRPEVEVHRVVGDEAAAVGEELLDGHLLPLAAPGAEGGEVRHDRVVEADPALLDERHDGGRGRDGLREGGQVEDGVDGHRLDRGRERAVAVGLPEGDLPVPADEDDGAGDLLLRDGPAMTSSMRASRAGERPTDSGATVSSGGGAAAEREAREAREDEAGAGEQKAS